MFHTRMYPYIVNHSVKKLRQDCDALERVLARSTYFLNPKEEPKIVPPPFHAFLYKRLYASTGSLPSSSIKKFLGWKYVTINFGINAVYDDMRFAMSYCLPHNPTVRGFNVPSSAWNTT